MQVYFTDVRKRKMMPQEVSVTLFQSCRLVWAGQFIWAATSRTVWDTAVVSSRCEAALGRSSSRLHTEACVLLQSLNTRGLWEGDERQGLNVTSIWEIGTYNVAGVICFHHFCGLFEFIIHKPSGNYTLWRFSEFWKSLFFFPNSVLFVCFSAPYHC